MGITCKQATEYIVKKEEGKVTARQRFLLWRHLAICSLCRLFQVQNKIIVKSLSAPFAEDDTTLSEQDKQVIVGAMRTHGEAK
jgi:hypothetical protein